MMFILYNDKKKIFERIEIKSGNTLLDMVVDIVDFPTFFVMKLVNIIINNINSPGNLSQDDSENIRKIIEEGRKQKVSEMEIEMSRDVATGVSINGLEGVDVTIGSKGNTKYMMKVKYKYD